MAVCLYLQSVPARLGLFVDAGDIDPQPVLESAPNHQA